MTAPEARRGEALAATGAGLLALAGAGVLAALVRAVQPVAGTAPERAVALSGAVLVLAVAVGLGAYTVTRRRSLSPTELGLAALLALGMALGGCYLFWVAPSVRFRADILIWAESPYVNDILKFRVGHPLYSAPANLESSFYTPGAPLLTYLLAHLAGHGTSIPFFRLLQLGYATAAALVAAQCVRLLARLAAPEEPQATGRLPSALWTVVLFLAATNAITNPFAHLLHNDSLSLLVSAVGYWLVLAYATSRARWHLAAMAVLPAAGFLVKQSLVLWAVLFGLYLLVFDRPRSWRRVLGYGAAAAALLVLTYGACWALWGEPFRYWAMGLGNNPVSPLRAVLHALEAWPYAVAGIAGGWLLMPAGAPSRLLGAWVLWALLGAAEAYTSGIAWMLNHLGPACLLAMVWLCAAMTRAWPRWTAGGPAPAAWWRTALIVTGLGFAFQGLGFVRVPLPSLTADHVRYAAAIEREFADLPADRVLLDDGTWLYLAAGVVQRDRGAPAADAGFAGTADFSGMLARLRERRYARILVRGLDRGELEYDDAIWRRPSGVRDSLLAHYRVVREIPEVRRGPAWHWRQLGTITVLEPRD